MPLDIGRVTHLLDQMHRSEDDAGDPIDAGFLLAADGARGQEWVDPSTIGGSTDAVDIDVADAAGYFSGTNVETVLQEFAKKTIGYQAHGNTGSTETFDALTGWHSATLDANSTFTFTGATSGLVASMVLELLQDGTGSRLVTWPGSVVWAAGSAPTLSTTPAATDVLLFESRDGGTNWFGFPTGAAGSALTIKDEGSSLATAATSVDFVGAGVTASGTGAAKTVTIPGVGAGVGPILITDTPAGSPLVFADLLQTDEGDDLLYADI